MERQITLGACEDSMNFFRVTLVKATVGIHGPNEMKVGYINCSCPHSSLAITVEGIGIKLSRPKVVHKW